MARTRISPADVISSSARACTVQNVVVSVASGIASTRGGVDGQILNSNGIGIRLENVRRQVEQLGNTIGMVYHVVENGAILYQGTETNVVGMGKMVLGVNVKQTGTERVNPYDGYFISESTTINEKEESENESLQDYLNHMIGGVTLTGAICDIFPGLMLMNKGLVFAETTDSSGKIYLSLKNTKNYTKKELMQVLKNEFSDINWTNYDVRRLINDGIPIYNKSGSETREWKEISAQLKDAIKAKEGFNFIECVEKLKNQSVCGKLVNAGKEFGGSFGNSIKDGFGIKYEGSTRMSRSLGLIGTGLTMATDVYDNIYNEDTGEWTFTPQTVANTATDFAIDLISGSASSAVGSAIGSFFLPPVGTIVGAAAGVAIDYAINNIKIKDYDEDGKKDSAIDMAKIGVDNVLRNIFNW